MSKPVSAVICLRSKIYQQPPQQKGEGVGPKHNSIGDVGKNIYKEMFKRVTVVRGKSYWSSPLMMNLVNMTIQRFVMSKSVICVEEYFIHQSISK